MLKHLDKLCFDIKDDLDFLQLHLPNQGSCVSTHSHFANFSGNDLTRIKRNSYFMEKK